MLLKHRADTRVDNRSCWPSPVSAACGNIMLLPYSSYRHDHTICSRILIFYSMQPAFSLELISNKNFTLVALRSLRKAMLVIGFQSVRLQDCGGLFESPYLYALPSPWLLSHVDPCFCVTPKKHGGQCCCSEVLFSAFTVAVVFVRIIWQGTALDRISFTWAELLPSVIPLPRVYE